jgi:hypothetical protein
LRIFCFNSHFILSSSGDLWKNPIMQRPLAGVISGQGVAHFLNQRTQGSCMGKLCKKQVAENLIVLLTADGVLSIFPGIF